MSRVRESRATSALWQQLEDEMTHEPSHPHPLGTSHARLWDNRFAQEPRTFSTEQCVSIHDLPSTGVGRVGISG